MSDRAFTQTPIESLPLHSAEVAFAGCERAIIMAPHPDDETLGCGGAIALLRQRSIPVRVLVMSDGTGSHPHSRRYPADRLRKLRETETCAALERLGVDAAAVTFLRLPDTAVPHPGEAAFPNVVKQCCRYFHCHSPSLLFVPWRDDQHCDHRATWQIVKHCFQDWPQPPRQEAYAVWGSKAAGLSALPVGETGWRLDIRLVQAIKRHAVMAYRSQITDLIDDDPDGFRLTPAMLANLIQPWETYLEAN